MKALIQLELETILGRNFFMHTLLILIKLVAVSLPEVPFFSFHSQSYIQILYTNSSKRLQRFIDWIILKNLFLSCWDNWWEFLETPIFQAPSWPCLLEGGLDLTSSIRGSEPHTHFLQTTVGCFRSHICLLHVSHFKHYKPCSILLVENYDVGNL